MTDQLGALTTIFTEFYYWITVVLMFLIHVGFCMYEVGASRLQTSPTYLNEKHYADTFGNSDVVFIWLVDILGFPTGPGLAPSIMNESAALITDESLFSAKWYVPTSDLMAVNLGDHIAEYFGLRSYCSLGLLHRSSLELLLKELQLLHLEFAQLQ